MSSYSMRTSGKCTCSSKYGRLCSTAHSGDLLGGSVGAPVAVGAVSIPLLQEALVLALEFVVEDDAPQAVATLGDPVGGLQVGSIDLDVVLQLARLPDARVERLSAVLARPAPGLEQLTSVLRQGDDTVSVSR